MTKKACDSSDKTKRSTKEPRIKQFMNGHMVLFVTMLRDKAYLSTLIHLALPIILQNLISSSLNMVGVVMIGQLGDQSVAAVGLGNQVFFLLNFVLFGISSGSAIFTAQFWGKEDIPSIRRVLGFSLWMALAASLFFSLVAVLFPAAALGLYTNDPAVIALGTGYLRLVGLSYVTTAVTYTWSAACSCWSPIAAVIRLPQSSAKCWGPVRI